MLDKPLTKISRANQRYGVYTPKIAEFCFIIGAMKSGTTTLYRYLAQHPQLLTNRFQKECEFFSQPEAPSDTKPYFRQYLKLPLVRQIALDGSTGYSKMPAFPNVAERLKALPGRKHFLYILRDPVDRVESHIAHNLACGADVTGFTTPEVIEHYLAVSRYAHQLDAYRAAFPDTPVHLYNFQDLKTDPLGLVRQICRDLDLADSYAFKLLAPQNTRSRKSVVQKFRLSEEQRQMIGATLAPDVARLRDQYRLDVSRWGLL